MKTDKNLIQANIDLLDKNKMLERDVRILTTRINKAIKYIDVLKISEIDKETLEKIKEILKNA